MAVTRWKSAYTIDCTLIKGAIRSQLIILLEASVPDSTQDGKIDQTSAEIGWKYHVSLYIA